MNDITVRPAETADAGAMAAILNPIIRAGGTTALESEVTDLTLRRLALEAAQHVCCHVALDVDGSVAGFQWLDRNPKLPPDICDIATFTRRRPRLHGAGRALFAATREAARHAGFAAINATIRADNAGGLTYYGRMGFVDHSVSPGVPLGDGTPVDRVHKRFAL